MHVVGSTKGHPEMIWASFEHFGNTPNPSFDYINSGGTQTTVAQNTSGTWLFSKSGSTGPFESAHMTQVGADIQASSPSTDLASLEQRLTIKMLEIEQRLAVKMGAMIAAGFGILLALEKLIK